MSDRHDRQRRLDALYRDTAAAGHQARAWFDGPGRAWRETLPPAARAAVATASLDVTTRLLAVMCWLLDPENAGDTPALRPFAPPDRPPLPASHPLHGQPGAAIVRNSEALVARAQALAAR